jgi:hypothetical protein
MTHFLTLSGYRCHEESTDEDSIFFCSSGDGTWCSIVSETAAEKDAFGKGMSVALPSITRTPLFAMRRCPAAFQNILHPGRRTCDALKSI